MSTPRERRLANITKTLGLLAKERPHCEACEVLSYHELFLGPLVYVAPEAVPERMRELDFELLPNLSAAVRRCPSCANTLRYPWIATVTPEAALAWLEPRLDAANDAPIPVDWDELKQALDL